jgi:hypothetical protein
MHVRTLLKDLGDDSLLNLSHHPEVVLRTVALPEKIIPSLALPGVFTPKTQHAHAFIAHATVRTSIVLALHHANNVVCHFLHTTVARSLLGLLVRGKRNVFIMRATAHTFSTRPLSSWVSSGPSSCPDPQFTFDSTSTRRLPMLATLLDWLQTKNRSPLHLQGAKRHRTA